MAKKRQCTLVLGVCGLILTYAVLVPQVYGLAESTASGGSNAQAVHQLGETGADVNIGLISAFNVYENHEAFFDKDVNGLPTGITHVTNLDFTGAGLDRDPHDTWMAGIAASRGGVSHVNDVGAAPATDIYSARVITTVADWHWIENALEDLIIQRGCRVIMTGIAFDPCGMPPTWPDLSMMYDYFADEYNTVFANASGNDYNNIQIFGDAYNGITTGALIAGDGGVYDQPSAISGSGPTSDGRRKPDLVAPANDQNVPESGSSFWRVPFWNDGRASLAVPHTAGTAALLLGLADDTANTNDSHNEVIKAVIVNSTFPNIKDESGDSTNPADSNNVWHKDRGYGRIDALRAYQLLSASQVSKGTTISQPKGWAFDTMDIWQKEEDNYYIIAQAGDRLVLTLTWNRKVSAGYVAENPLYNLDLYIYEPNGTELFRDTGTVDNLIKVDLPCQATGEYRVLVKEMDFTTDDRDYALAFELVPPIVADLNLDYGVDENDLSIVKDNWLQNNPDVDAALLEDGIVNLKDFAVLANNWRSSNPAYYSQ